MFYCMFHFTFDRSLKFNCIDFRDDTVRGEMNLEVESNLRSDESHEPRRMRNNGDR